ncbi:MAG: polysaccharide biosynthesis C-terminal domain-containing protein, partial [Acholeplasma sp.]|nr:polysaccharide biosynthesis C-terminal domain-containing protein [Acholeplasma sp.]
TPVYNSIFALLINVILNLCIYFFTDWSIWGLALTTTISVFITTILLYYNLNKKVQKFKTVSIVIVLFKIMLLSIFVASLAKILYNYLLIREISGNYSTLISIGAAIIIYLIFLPILKIEEIDGVIKSIKKMIMKFRGY